MVGNIQQRVTVKLRRLIFLFLFVLSVIGWLAIVTAPRAGAVDSVPLKMNYQGRLTNASGAVLADGTYNMRLKLYSAATSGTLLWSENRLVSAGTPVTLKNGLFSIQLGSVTTLPASLFNSQTFPSLYLEVELPTPATATASSPSWTEGVMTPRNQLASSAFAFNSDTLDGLDSSAFAQIGGTNTFTGTNTFRTTTNGTQTFSIQNSSGDNLLKADTSNNRIAIGNGNTDTDVTFLAVDTYTGAGDPAGGFNGAIYYNATLGKLRCYESGYWDSCVNDVTVAGSVSTVSGPWAATAAISPAAAIAVSPIYIPAQITVNQIRLRVTTALGAAGDVGIYDAFGNRLLNGGTNSLTTAAGLKTITPVQTGWVRLLQPGYYFMAATWNSTTGVIAGANMGVAGLKYNGIVTSGGGSTLPSYIGVGTAAQTEGNYIYAFSIND